MTDDETNKIDCPDYSDGCKYFHHEPYYTPNNFDLYFDYNSIPVNIQPEKSGDLRTRLQKLMPLSMIIHVNLDNDTINESNNVHIVSRLHISYTDVTGKSVSKEVQIR